MEIRYQVITVPARARNQGLFSLLPFGDMQVGSPLFHEETWDKYVAAVRRAVNPITIGMGDYADHFRPTMQEKIRGSVGGDRDALMTIQDMHREFIDKHVYPRLKDVVQSSHCLGLLAGHHDMDYFDGTNSTQYLCRRLKVQYLGRGEAITRVELCFNQHRKLCFDVMATHGEGHGATVGAPVGKLQKLLAYFDVDIILRAHSCDKFIFQEPQYYLTRAIPPKLRQRNRIIANTGGFSDSRVEGVDTYVERANMIPKAMGWVEIHVHVKRDDSPTTGRKGNGSHYIVIGD